MIGATANASVGVPLRIWFAAPSVAAPSNVNVRDSLWRTSGTAPSGAARASAGRVPIKNGFRSTTTTLRKSRRRVGAPAAAVGRVNVSLSWPFVAIPRRRSGGAPAALVIDVAVVEYSPEDDATSTSPCNWLIVEN